MLAFSNLKKYVYCDKSHVLIIIIIISILFILKVHQMQF